MITARACIVAVALAGACSAPAAPALPSNHSASDRSLAPMHDEVFGLLLRSEIQLPIAECDGASTLGERVDHVVIGLSSTGPLTGATRCRAHDRGWQCRTELTAPRRPSCDQHPRVEQCWVTTLEAVFELELDLERRIVPASLRCTTDQR